MFRFVNKVIVILVLLVCFGFKQISAQDSLRIMYYNLLNYPGSSSERVAYFRTITHYVKADILLVNELLNDEGAVTLLEDGLNAYGNRSFKKAAFTDGPNTNNMLFYDSTKVTLYSQDSIITDLRLIDEYVLFSNKISNDTTFLYLYSAHLKASSGSVNEQKRLAEVREFKKWVDDKTEIENIFFGGDLNFYSFNEPAYDTLIYYGVHPLNDPLLAGNWHNNALFSDIHSQSTRTDQFGGGASGGLDDRFDFIFYSDDVIDGTNGATYVANSCKIIGNDGNHFDVAIIDPPVNTAVPDSVLQALYYMSDHLPVICDIDLKDITEIKEKGKANRKVKVFPNPTSKRCTVSFDGVTGQTKISLFNGFGAVLRTEQINIDGNMRQMELDLSDLKNGVYYFSVIGADFAESVKIIVCGALD